jgi:hypothetical protein
LFTGVVNLPALPVSQSRSRYETPYILKRVEPEYRTSSPVGLGDHRVVRNLCPHAIDRNPISGLAYVVFGLSPISLGTAEALAAFERVKPLFEWAVGVSAVVTGHSRGGQQKQDE